jgi:hypothetical protein
MKKTSALLACFGLFTTLTAQKIDMQLLELNDVAISKPVIMGKVGTHYMVYDQASRWPTVIYVIDSTFKLSNTARQYIGEQYFQFVPSGNNMYLIWRTAAKDSLNISVSRIDELGNDNLFQRSVCFFPKKDASQPLLITDINSNYFLFYSWITDTDKRMYLRAVVFDSAWNERTNITSPVPFDKTTSSITRPMLDAAGNIHFAVHDKLSNYHLSSTITLYTIQPQKEELLSASFEVDKQKFYNLSLQDDTAAKEVNILGYYYDGHEKTKKGIASLRAPYENTSQKIKTQFYPFSQEFIDFLYKNIRHARKKENPAEYLHIREIYERDGRIITGNSVLDLPSYQLTKESDIGKDAPPNKSKDELDRVIQNQICPRMSNQPSNRYSTMQVSSFP